MSGVDPNGGGPLLVPGGATGSIAASSLSPGTAGQGIRTNAGATAGEWADPDLVCTFAELSTTYAPSAVLRGVIAYASDKLATYVCRRTAASTYAWRVIAYERALPGGATAQAWWKLEEAAGSTTFANSGAGGTATLTATTSGSGAEVNAGTGSGPWGQPCVLLVQSSTPGAAYLESLSGVIEPAQPVTFALWVKLAPTFFNSDTFARFGKKWNSGFTAPTNAIAMNVGAIFNASTVSVGGVATAGTSARGVTQGEWTHVAVTYNGTSQIAYLNGRARAATAQSGAIDYGTGSGRTWYFGSSPASSADRLNGQLSEIRVDGTAWYAATVLEAYQRGVGTWDGGL